MLSLPARLACCLAGFYFVRTRFRVKINNMSVKTHVWTAPAIHAFRLSLGMTQTEFALRLGLERQQTCSEWESGMRKPSNMAKRLLDYVWQETAHERTKSPIHEEVEA